MNAALKAILITLGKAAWRMARDFMQRDARARGEWLGTYRKDTATQAEAEETGYTDWKKCVRVTVDSRDPLRFRHESGVEYGIGIGRALISDGGSIPSWWCRSYGKWGELVSINTADEKAFFLHDEAYHNGGIYVRYPSQTGYSKWHFLAVTRRMADLLLYQGLTATTATNAACKAIYAGVRTPFGAASWRKCRQRILDKTTTNK